METTTYVIPDIKQEARAMARETLSRSASFQTMPLEEQKGIYLNLVNENIGKLRSKYGLAQAMAKGPGKDMGFEGYDPGFEGSVDAFEDLVDSVDFPKFVADLLKAVFDANISVMKSQTDDFIRLMREATKGVSEFIKQVSEDDAFAYLADTKSDQFNILMEENPEGGSKMALTTPEGEKVDMEDNEVKAKIMEAKIAMAKEHRAALREVLLMGVTRLVVEKGEVEAGVEFMIKANRESLKTHKDQNVNTSTLNTSYSGPLGGIFGGPKGSFSMTNTNIQVNTSSKKATDELTAKLMGKVNIKFKTDYFELNNFAQMYGNAGVAAFQPPQNGATVPQK